MSRVTSVLQDGQGMTKHISGVTSRPIGRLSNPSASIPHFAAVITCTIQSPPKLTGRGFSSPARPIRECAPFVLVS